MERKKLEKYELEKNDSIDVKMKDKLEKRISSYRNKTRNVSREVSTLKIKLSGLFPKLNSTVNDNNSIDKTDNATDNSTEEENVNNTEDDTNNSADNDIDDSTIDLDNDDTVAGVIWKTLTPRSKGKVKANLKNQILPKGLSYAVRKAVNVNLCNELTEHVPYSSKLPRLKNSSKGMMFRGRL